MNILVIGSSPYLLTKGGRIVSSLVKHLSARGHRVSGLVWHHDEGYFMPDEQGNHAYEWIGGRADLYPVVLQSDQAVARAYEVMKAAQPQVVLTVADYDEGEFIYSLKAMYPSYFKWVAVMLIDSLPINPNHYDRLQYVDHLVAVTDMGFAELSKASPAPVTMAKLGPSEDFGYLGDKEGPFTALWSGKNAQSCNLPCFLSALSAADGVRGHVHANFYDPGEYDIDLLMDRYGVRDRVTRTEEYVAIKDGISDEAMNRMYNRCHAIVDTSVKSATAMTVLEGMAAGCIPVGPDYGAVGEVISNMPEKHRFFVPFEIYVGNREEEHVILSKEGLKSVLLELQSVYEQDRSGYLQAVSAACGVARNFSKDLFLDRITHVVEKVISVGDTLVVEAHT